MVKREYTNFRKKNRSCSCKDPNYCESKPEDRTKFDVSLSVIGVSLDKKTNEKE